MPWQTRVIFGSSLGPLRGLMETGGLMGGSQEGAPAVFLTQADNVAFTGEGRLRKRPGRVAVSGFGSRANPQWTGTAAGLLYDADGAAIRQAGTSVLPGLDAGALSGAVYGDSAGNTWLLVCDGSSTVRKITGTTASAITGFPAASPACVAVAGRRVFFAEDNTVFWSTFSPTLTASGEWPTDNELSIADPGLSAVRCMVEFGGLLYVFGANAVAQIDPRDPEAGNSLALSGFGTAGLRAAVAGKDRIFFSDGGDVYAWAPGGQPQSITQLRDGRSLVRGLLTEAAATNPFTVLGYDPARDLLFVSNSEHTLVFAAGAGAWTRWTFGVSCWTLHGGAPHLTQTALSETLTLDWDVHQDVIAGADAMFTWTIRSAPQSTGRESQIVWKKLRFGFPGDSALSEGEVRLGILRDGALALSGGEVSLEVSGGFVMDSSLLGGDDVLGGSGSEAWRDVSLPYPQGNLLGVELSAANNQPFQLHSLLAQADERRAMHG